MKYFSPPHYPLYTNFCQLTAQSCAYLPESWWEVSPRYVCANCNVPKEGEWARLQSFAAILITKDYWVAQSL